MARRLLRGGRELVGFDRDTAAVKQWSTMAPRARGRSRSLAAALGSPRIVWLMVPDTVVDAAIASLSPHLAAGDVVIDGGNSNFQDAARRAPRR